MKLPDFTKPCIKCGATDRYTSGACRPCGKAMKAKYYAKNTELVKAAMSKWKAANREKNLAAKAKHYAENTEQVKANSAKYYTDNTEYAKAINAKWRADHPEKRRAAWHKRRAIKLKAGGAHTAEDIKAMLKSQKGKCVVCWVNISKAYHIDHIMPLALGGHNGISNIQLLCPRCNQSKHAKHPINFMQERGFLL